MKDMRGIMDNRIYFEKFASEEDFEDYLKLVLNEQVMKMNYGRVFTLEEAKMLYARVLKKNKIHEDFGDLKLFESDSKSLIGICSLSVNKELTEAEVEYLLLPGYWGKGYGTETLVKLLNMAQGTKSIEKITAITDPCNKASKKMLLNNGFVSCKVYEIDDGSLAEEFSKKMDNS